MKPLQSGMFYRNREETIMYDNLHLTNMLRSEVEHIPETGLPLDVFPDKIQEIILNLARYENFNVEYTASIILSAVATAIGNSCHIRIKGEWKTCPSLYMMLVGRPGLGKTPPLGFIYKPINEYDDRLHEKYNEECDEYERAMSVGKHGNEVEGQLLKKPNFVTTVIYDSTPEAMMNIHQYNQRGITLVVDEILALFNSVKRYNSKNNLIEDLLTAYSGQPLKVIRKSESRPILIKNPCINVIGSVQTNMLQEVFRTEFLANGLLDRFLFVYPKNRKISGWRREERNTVRPDIMNQWRTIINRVFSIPCILDEKGMTVNPRILTMSDDAEECFYEWYNGIIDAVNAIEDDADVESRKMKLNGHVARLALLFQIMKWATDDDDMQYIEQDSVRSAIRMIDIYEETYRRIQEAIVINSIGETKESWLSLLGETFTSGDAVVAGRKVDMSRRTVYYALDQLCRLQHPLIAKLQHGVYRKLVAENTDAPCTFALSFGKDAMLSSRSAKVQSATTENSGNHE